MVEARDRHEHQGIEAALAERGMVLAEKYAEMMLTALINVIGQAPIDRHAQKWIGEHVADELEAKVVEALPVQPRL